MGVGRDLYGFKNETLKIKMKPFLLTVNRGAGRQNYPNSCLFFHYSFFFGYHTVVQAIRKKKKSAVNNMLQFVIVFNCSVFLCFNRSLKKTVSEIQ